MNEIDFAKIRTLNDGQRESFEELCCQIFRRHYTKKLPKSSQYFRFRGSGGDGGVEAIYILDDGNKIGIQSKFFEKTNLKASQFRQMTDSVNQAISNHPELQKYIFCLPFQPTGKTSRGKGQTENLEDWKNKILDELKTKGFKLGIVFWCQDTLVEKLIDVDPHGGMRRYWFDQNILTHEWMIDRLEQAKEQAGERYTPQLSIDVPAMNALDAFASREQWEEKATQISTSLHQTVEDWDREFKSSTLKATESITKKLHQIQDELETKIHSKQTNADEFTIICEETQKLIAENDSHEKEELKKFLKEHGDHADTKMFREFHMEYQCDFPASALDTTRTMGSKLYEFKAWLDDPGTSLQFTQFMLLRGIAGIGKTHAIMDHAIQRSRARQFCFVVFGEDFHNQEPWQTISSKLGLSNSIGQDELWTMFDTAAEATGNPALIYIDAVNEPDPPARNRWKKSWLSGLRQQISQYPNIKLCISCRDAFLQETIDDETKWPTFKHNGFIGKEYEAIRAFFEFYKLEPPISPLFQKEFSNPLFLHLICQGLQGAEQLTLPLGSIGFSKVLQILIDNKNTQIAATCGYDPNDDNVGEALKKIATTMAEKETRLLPYNDAKKLIESIYSNRNHNRSLIYNLEKEGLISVINRNETPLAKKDLYCRITFERVADHLIAQSLLENIENGTLYDEFDSGKLAFLIESEGAIHENKGVLEAISIIIPERYHQEISSFVVGIDRYKTLLPIIFAGFQWRDKSTFMHSTRRLIEEGLSNPETVPHAFDALFDIAVVPEHLLNAQFINSILLDKDMTSRDPFWSFLLHEDFTEKKGAWRLTEWSLHADLNGLSDETCRLWALALSWFCAASDRRIRDRATKGLVRVFLSKPEVIAPILEHFLSVDDDYIIERVSLAAYGAHLIQKEENSLSQTADLIYRKIFEKKKVPLNVSIRDNLRLILELADSNGLLPPHTDKSLFRPPYNSPWPLQIPNKEVVAEISKQDAFRTVELEKPGLESDFQRYTIDINILRQFDLKTHSISREDILSWLINGVSELGYPGEDEQ